jgi:serine O-acetyltransferase
MPPDMSWQHCRSLIRSDATRFCDAVAATGVAPARRRWKLLFTPEVAALVLYRVSHWHWRRGRFGMAGLLYRFNITLTGADIHPSTEIGPSCLIVHTVGTVLFGKFGNGVTIYARVIVDCADLPAIIEHAPCIGHGVVLGAMSSVLGPVQLADEVKIGPGSLIDFSVTEPRRLVSRLPGERTFTAATHTVANNLSDTTDEGT